MTSHPSLLSRGRKLERDVLGGPAPDVADDDVGREAPGIARIDYDLRAILVLARVTRLPALIEDLASNESAK